MLRFNYGRWEMKKQIAITLRLANLMFKWTISGLLYFHVILESFGAPAVFREIQLTCPNDSYHSG